MAPRLFLLHGVPKERKHLATGREGSEVLLETPQWLDVAFRAAGGRVASVYLLH